MSEEHGEGRQHPEMQHRVPQDSDVDIKLRRRRTNPVSFDARCPIKESFIFST